MRSMCVVVAVLLGCGGGPAASKGEPPRVAAAFSATRWVPDDPSYVVAAPTVRAAHRSLRDTIESFGILAGVEQADLSRALLGVLAIDPLSPDSITGAGVDLEGGLVMFSQRLAPTFVVRLAAPEQTQAFFDRQRERGLVTQSVVIDGVEVFSAQLVAKARASWAIADGWLWVHFSFPLDPDVDAAWFRASRAASGSWAPSWQWASAITRGRPASLLGFIRPRDVLARIVARVPEAARCVRLLEPVRRVAVAVEGDGTEARGTIALDLGDAAAAVSRALLPIPEGFEAAASGAPLTAQWNLDLLAVRGWLQPCLRALDEDLRWLDRYGVRAGRATLRAFDPDAKEGSGVVSLDLAHDKYLSAKLDEIPARSHLERSRRFGPLAGHSLTIPFVVSVDYVLDDKVGMLAVGEGLLARVVGGGRGTAGPVASLDVVPGGLSADAWRMLLGAARVRNADELVGRMMTWREGHVRVTVEDRNLVITARGARR